jgi:hypothetical protein
VCVHQETMSVCEFDKAFVDTHEKAYSDPEIIEACLRYADL